MDLIYDHLIAFNPNVIQQVFLEFLQIATVLEGIKPAEQQEALLCQHKIISN